MNSTDVEPQVTIGLPTYNRADLLERCVNSVINQKYQNWELIIYDDGSTDQTEEVSNKLINLDPRIKYYKQETREFLPKVRNSICRISNSDFIFFIEDDLLLEETCLKNLMRSYGSLILSNKVGAVTPRMLTYIDGVLVSLNIRNQNSPVEICEMTGLINNNFDTKCSGTIQIPAGHSCSLILKEAWSKIGGYEEKRYTGTNFREETDFYFRIRQQGYKIFFESLALTHHVKSNSGGCRLKGQYQRNYYYFRNHMLFLTRFYGWRTLYMIPLFIGHLVFRIVRPQNM